jgi:hypothetical protein
MPQAHTQRFHSYEEKFLAWMREHEVTFTDGHEFVRRLSIFADNDDFIAQENAKASKYTVGHNKFSMYTNEEFKQLMNLGKSMPNRQPSANVHNVREGEVTSSSVDWEAAGAVTGGKIALYGNNNLLIKRWFPNSEGPGQLRM